MAYALALAASMWAVGADVSLGQVASLVHLVGGSSGAGCGEVPGGSARWRAALVGSFTLVGVDSATATAGVLLYRLLTFWVPVLPGFYAFYWLEQPGACFARPRSADPEVDCERSVGSDVTPPDERAKRGRPALGAFRPRCSPRRRGTPTTSPPTSRLEATRTMVYAALVSPSFGLPAEPTLMKSTPSWPRCQGTWVWPKTSTSASSAAARRSKVRASRSLSRYSLMRRGLPWTRWKCVPRLEAQLARERSQPGLVLVGHRRHGEGVGGVADASRLVVRVVAAAVASLEAHAVVVVAGDGGDGGRAHQLDDHVRLRTVPHQVA